MNRRLALYDPDRHPPDGGDGDAPDEPAACRPTLALLQRTMDGEAPAPALADDPHARQCPSCRGRAAAARFVLGAFAEPAASAVPSHNGIGDVLAAVAADRRGSRRKRWAAAAVGAALAAGVLVAAFDLPAPPARVVLRPDETVPGSDVPAPAPTAPPAKIGEAWANAGDALAGIGRTIAAPVDAPDVLAPLADMLGPPPIPDLAPAARTLAEWPEAVRNGLEPVTDSATRAFAHLLHDVSAVRPGPRAKS